MGAANSKSPSAPPDPRHDPVTGAAGSIHRALVREHHKKMEDYYEILEEIGRGGLCKVYKIRKKPSKVGGTSRSDNVVRRSRLPLWGGTSSGGDLLYWRRRSSADTSFSSVPPSSAASLDGSVSSKPLYFAMKEINLTLVAPEKVEQLKYEVEILKAFDHKHIIRAHETFYSGSHKVQRICIVMELCKGGDLHSQFPYTEQRAAQITGQILSAVAYMHSASIIHRELC